MTCPSYYGEAPYTLYENKEEDCTDSEFSVSFFFFGMHADHVPFRGFEGS